MPRGEAATPPGQRPAVSFPPRQEPWPGHLPAGCGFWALWQGSQRPQPPRAAQRSTTGPRRSCVAGCVSQVRAECGRGLGLGGGIGTGVCAPAGRGTLQHPRHHLAEGREAALTLDLCPQERSSSSTATGRERPLSASRVYQGSPSPQTTTPDPTARTAGTVTPVRAPASWELGAQLGAEEPRGRG